VDGDREFFLLQRDIAMKAFFLVGLLGCGWNVALLLGAEDTKPAAVGAAVRVVGKDGAKQANLHAEALKMSKLDMSRGDATAPPAAPSAGITLESLKAMIEGLGYEPKLNTFADGSQNCEVAFPRGTWSIYVNMSLSPDKSNLWMTVLLTSVPDPAKASGAAVLSLLEKEDAVWPGYITYYSGPKTLWLSRPMKTDALKPAMLRSNLESMADSIIATAPQWDTSKWSEATATAPAPPAPTAK
jgi:hypothetical protein